MSEPFVGFLDEVVQHYRPAGAPGPEAVPRSLVETLLVGDGQRRRVLAERVALDWGMGERHGPVTITAERLLVTPHGLLFAAMMGGASKRPTLLYLASTRGSFDDVVDRIRLLAGRATSVVAVDSRYGHELDYVWPLDVGLRRRLDATPVLYQR